MASLHDLLMGTSRTFALAIPLLPEPTQSTTCLAYLLFRVADTLEDAATWSRIARLDALAEWAELLRTNDVDRAKAASERWTANGATSHVGYRALLAAVPQILGKLAHASAGERRIVRVHALRTVDGMRQTLERTDAAGRVSMKSLEELRSYCYVVAGIVGELLTELFVYDSPALSAVSDALIEDQVAFGEGLQLVNILKDESQDTREGRGYLPPGVGTTELIELARRDLVRARRYIGALERGGAPPGFSAFTSLAADLAQATLVRLEQEGPGAKVPRAEVLRLYAHYQIAASTPAATDHSARAQSGKYCR